MNFLRKILRTVLDALFPLSKAEEELLGMSPEEAFGRLPPAPAYDASVAPLPGSRSVFAYKDERVSRLVWSIKYKKSTHAIRIAGYALYKNLPVGQSFTILPIPITKQRRRERGFNQCALLLDEIQKLDDENRFKYEKNLLERVQHSSRQTLKGRSDRLQSSKGIFAARENTLDKGTPLIVIDDVVTTGSTIKEALDVLTAAGFTNVRGLSLAH